MLTILASNEIFVGSELMARFKNVQHIAREFVPIRILHEFPTYFVCEVLPHESKSGLKQSKSYRLTIDKWDLDHKNVVCTYNYL